MGKLFRGIQKLEEILLASAMILIALLTIVNVFSRSLFGESLAYAQELSQFLMVFVTFIGLGYAAGKGRHIRMTAIYDQLPLRVQRIMMILIAGLTATLLFVFAYYSVTYAMTAKALGTVSPALQVPMWIVYLAAPLGLVLGGVQYVLTVVRNLGSDEVWLSWEQKDEYESSQPTTV
ncbi:MAG: TRAP transporter small permease [Myxococcota bacterium]